MAKVTVRLGAVQVVFGIGFLALWMRSGQLQLVEGERHREAALRQRTERVEIPAPRGGIYDRNGTPLALTQESYHVGLAPNELRANREAGEIEADVRRIARALNLPVSSVRRAARSNSYRYYHGPFSAAQIHEISDIHGVHPEREFARFYPDSGLARALLGRVAAPGRPASGLERVFDSLLTGVPGRAVVLRDRRGVRYESPSRLDAFPMPGADIHLTIDAELQEIVESSLNDALRQYDALSGDVVVLRPSTGEVLALASLRADGRELLDALTGVYEPGSTAKLFAAAALVEGGHVEPDDSVWGEEGTWVTEHRTITDVYEVGWVNLDGVIENSSNIGIVKFAARLPSEAQYDMLRRFGFGTPTGIEFPVESRGRLRRPSEWSALSGASLAMGYEMAVTPLQLAAAYGAIANDGVLLRPTLLKEVQREGQSVYRQTMEPVRRVVSSETAQALRRMLSDVVYRHGMGSTAALTSYEVAGKTGTARRTGTDGRYVTGGYFASFAALFPADEPQLVLVVKLVDPRGTYGAQTAAPVTRSVLEQTLASRSDALDHGRLSRESDPVVIVPPAASDSVVERVAWPRAPEGRADSTVVVPDVAGMGLREATRALHAAGLRVRVDGWGVVRSSTPGAGAPAAPRSVVVLRAGGR